MYMYAGGVGGDNRHFHERYLYMMGKMKAVSNIGAARLGPSMKVIYENIGEVPIMESAPSETTILRAWKSLNNLETTLLRENLAKASNISYHWDLSPQGNKELLVTTVSATFLKKDTPAEYKNRVAGDDNVDTFEFYLPIMQCANKKGLETVGPRVRECLKLVGLTMKGKDHHSGVAYVTSDKGSENKPAATHAFGAEAFVFIHCLAHALNLCFTHACDALPGKRTSKLMSHRWVAWVEKVVNLLRRHWQSFSVYHREETKWPGHLSKPERAVRTRWLMLIMCFSWMFGRGTNVRALRQIILKYYIKGANGKFSAAWQQAYAALCNKEFLQCGTFLVVWGDKFFTPALEWIRSKGGYRAPEMPQQIEVWKCQIRDLRDNYECYFDDLINNTEYGMGDSKAKQMVEDFSHELLTRIDYYMGAWLKLPLCLGQLLLEECTSPAEVHCGYIF